LTPSLDLVQRSRYYRGTPFKPELRGAWWPFILTAMLVYGLLPRIIAFVVASVQLRKATRDALGATPGALELLGRLEGRGERSAQDADEEAATMSAERVVTGSRPVVIDWSRAAGSAARAASLIGLEPASYEPAGGARSVQDDRQTLEAVGQAVSEDGVVVLVKLWEPPVIETTTFLSELRKAIGDRLPVRVVPVASDASGRVIGDGPVLLEQWKRRVGTLGDPWTAVAVPVGEAANDEGATDG
jgi:hypothetical protein